jgi:rhamnulose-1-phosphate aldolase/alcohol dehydrogenase
MSTQEAGSRLTNLWDKARAAGMSEPELLLYRSNLLGSDKRVTNYGGGNTSAKVMQKDPLTGETVEVLWVKGSGGDVGTIRMDGFATLYMDKLRALKGLYRGVDFEDEMVGYLPHCTFNLNARAASIDTPLHAYVPKKHVDHMHPDAIIAIAASANSKALTQQIFGGEIGWLPWKRPGFELGLWLETFCLENPGAKGVVLESHGLFTWADDAESCYGLTIDVINRAIAWFETETAGKPIFGGEKHKALAPRERRAVAARLMPAIRGMVSEEAHMVGHFDDSDAVLQFVCGKDMVALAALGTSCPDHFLRTKVRPLVLDVAPDAPLADAIARLKELHAAYRADYQAYYERYATKDSPPMRGADPAIVLVPGVGMFSYGADKQTARVAGEFYLNAINVMRGAEAVSSYAPIAESEKFRIEYWELEEAKLRRRPKPKPLAGRIALVTGGGSGIGRATAQRLAAEGACVVVADRDAQSAQAVAAEIGSADVAVPVTADVTSEADIAAAVAAASLAFGGVDLVVNNAGLSVSKPLAETTAADWDVLHDVMARGSFLVSREAAKALEAQGMGGDIIYIVSKNAVFAGPANVAYGAAKADQAHQVRLLAAELGAIGVRVNGVNPDGVVRGSGIFAGGWGAKRAAVYGVPEEELGAFYAQRTLLKKEVLPEHIAAAVFTLAGGDLSLTTGLLIPVDAGVAAAFLR